MSTLGDAATARVGVDTTTTVEHDAIFDALEAGDPEAADRAMTAHLERSKEFLRQSLAAAA